jgi:hypothetical protein
MFLKFGQLGIVVGFLGIAVPASAFNGSLHQELTFIAAKQFNRCVTDSKIPLLTPLEVRYIAKANLGQAELSTLRRLVRWNYYDRKAQDEKSVLWFIQTRFHTHFRETVEKLHAATDLGDRYSRLGRIVNYLQEMTSPAHVVPVYTARWWRFRVGDRFDNYAIERDAVERMIGDDCSSIERGVGDYQALLTTTAEKTLEAVQETIPGMAVSWQVFWELGTAGKFGRYGDAGNNFGRSTEFRCTKRKGERCVLLPNDPLYEVFAIERHADAARATIRAMWLMQSDRHRPVVKP